MHAVAHTRGVTGPHTHTRGVGHAHAFVHTHDVGHIHAIAHTRGVTWPHTHTRGVGHAHAFVHTHGVGHTHAFLHTRRVRDTLVHACTHTNTQDTGWVGFTPFTPTCTCMLRYTQDHVQLHPRSCTATTRILLSHLAHLAPHHFTPPPTPHPPHPSPHPPIHPHPLRQITLSPSSLCSP